VGSGGALAATAAAVQGFLQRQRSVELHVELHVETQ
jgi:hypothetical protein